MTTTKNDLPTDVFPKPDELAAAIALDELCEEINREHDEEIERLTAAIDCRLDRLARGFSLIELLVALAIIGVITVIGIQWINAKPEARLAACAADLRACETLAMQADLGRTPSREALYEFAGDRWKSHYHYVSNNSDPNSGHGNDLDICDEENPGSSTENRQCLDISFIIVCDHNHERAGAKYNVVLDGYGVIAVPLEKLDGFGPGDPPDDIRFTGGLNWWHGKDPNHRKWIGR